jgi:hypothetical protein
MASWLKNTLTTVTICILSSLFVLIAWQINALGEMGHMGALAAIALIAIAVFTGQLLQILRDPSAAPMPVKETAPASPSQIPEKQKAHWDVESTSIIALPQFKASPHTTARARGALIRPGGSLRSTRTDPNGTMRLPTGASTS